MNESIEKFGERVGNMSKTNPVTARKMLCAAFALHRLQTSFQPMGAGRFVAKTSVSSVIGALRHPERSAIVNIFLPCELLHAMNITPQIAEGLSCFVSGAGSEQAFIKHAHESGIPETSCSYHKILTGLALSNVLPPPAFIAYTTMACDANTNTFRLLAEHTKSPLFTVDTPVDAGADAVKYVADQLRDLAVFIETVTGKKLSETALIQCVASSRRSMDAYRKYLDLLSRKYIRNDMTSEMYAIFSSHVMLGTKDTEKYFRILLRGAQKAPAYSAGNRLLWVHSLPYLQNSFRCLLNNSQKNQLLCSDMTFDSLTDMDETQPYESMAQRLLNNTFNGSILRRGDQIIRMAKKLNADGILFFCHWGCRNTAGGSHIVKKMADAEGIPLLVIDGDGCDRKNINDGQMRTRLEAFLEMLEGK